MTGPSGSSRPPHPPGQPVGDPALSTGDPNLWAPRLGRILDRQRDLYATLDGLARSQSERIEADDSDGLLDVLSRRQAVVDQVVALNDELTPFARRWEELAPRLSAPHRESLRRKFDEVTRLVQSIQQRDEADRRALESRRDAVGSELEGLARVRGAAAAYGKPPTSGPLYQDRSA
jgi:hypothetical protein